MDKLTGFVISNHKKGIVPLGAIANRLVNLLNEKLPKGDVTGGVHGIGVQTAARGIDVRELGQEPEVSVLEEVLDGNNVG